MSPTRDSTLADPQQIIAELQQQLAARTAEREEARAREAALGEVMQVINSSPGDLTPVFEAMLNKATNLCEGAFGILWTYDGERYHAVAFRNVPHAYAEFLRQPVMASRETPLGRIAAGEPLAHIPDLAAEEIFGLGSALIRHSVELGRFRTVFGVAMRKEETLLGAFTIYRQEVRPFSDSQIALLQNFAAQAVISMENARLITETREALRGPTCCSTKTARCWAELHQPDMTEITAVSMAC
jgi:GAF domain-containing protein